MFIVASILAVGFILYFFACSHHKQRVLHIALALTLAGALGNMIDRTVMRADRVVSRSPTGETTRVLGRIVGDPNSDPLQVGSWPEGSSPQMFDRGRLAEPPRSVGIVRDFIKIEPIAGHDVWPWVFNVADALLVGGVGLLLVGIVRERRASAEAGPAGVPTS